MRPAISALSSATGILGFITRRLAIAVGEKNGPDIGPVKVT
jgi:hypothetical protein